MLVTSRSLAEYRAMFSLTDADLTGRLLDCCAGAASLVAEVSAAGGHAVAADPVFARGPAQVEAAVRESLAGGQQLVDDHEAQFVWDWYGTRQHRDDLRAVAAERFLADCRTHPSRYLAAELPRLPFADRGFDLAVCSHLLFTWARRFDETWHRAALTELARVAAEVRVFPLVQAGDGAATPFLGALVRDLGADGHRVEIRPVTYEFQRGGNQMLVVIAR
ncbi:MAG: hypothetical protein WAL50_15230 [Kineosporiaceae bacterium]